MQQFRKIQPFPHGHRHDLIFIIRIILHNIFMFSPRLHARFDIRKESWFLHFPEFAPLLQARCDIRKMPLFPISPRFRTATCAICYCNNPSLAHFSVFCFATFNHKFIFTHSSSKIMRQKLIRSAGKPKNGYFSPAGPKIWHPGQLNINTFKWGDLGT